MAWRAWTRSDNARLCELFPHAPTAQVAAQLKRSHAATSARAALLGLRKTPEYLVSPAACRLRQGGNVGAASRFLKGSVPWNKGKQYTSGGRSAETRFKKGQRSSRWDPDDYAVGALRVNADGYIDMKIREGSRAWRQLHLILWEDAHGTVPRGHCLRFRDGDKLNVELANLELISRSDLMRRNTIHNLPAPLKTTIHALGRLKRRIRERGERGHQDGA